MSDLHRSHRLGDLLVEAGLITAAQLREAIDLQRERRLNEPESHLATEKYELGEILIELGFINRHQLKLHLSWQRRLRKTTAIMVFIAPMLTAACGGGGGGSSAGSGTTQNTAPVATQITSKSSSSSSSSPAEGGIGTAPATQSSSSIESFFEQDSSNSSSEMSVASSSVSSSSVLPVGTAQAGVINGPVQLYWSVPTSRENGDFLDITEIGGYELRYKLKTDSAYTSVTIKDGFTDAYYFDFLQGDYEFQIATFDKKGLYSDFVAINPSS